MSAVSNDYRSCSICFEPASKNPLIQFQKLTFHDVDTIKEMKDLTIQAKCNHFFHGSCLHTWLKAFKESKEIPPCPDCNSDLMLLPFVLGPVKSSMRDQTNQEKAMHLMHQAFDHMEEALKLLGVDNFYVQSAMNNWKGMLNSSGESTMNAGQLNLPTSSNIGVVHHDASLYASSNDDLYEDNDDLYNS